MADCIARAYSRQVTHLGGISRKGCKSHSARCVITREVTFRKAYGTFSQAQLPSGDICFEKVEKNLVEMMMFWLKKCRLLVGGFCTRSLVQKKSVANPCFGFVSFFVVWLSSGDISSKVGQKLVGDCVFRVWWNKFGTPICCLALF